MPSSVRFIAFLLSGLASLLSGCASWPLSSKWAAEDSVYSEKYDKPYGNDKTLRMLKQSVDARHINNRVGVSLGGYGADSDTGIGEFGGSWFTGQGMAETRLTLTGLHGTAADDAYFGAGLGLRLQTPTRLAPFIGISGFLGGLSSERNTAENGLDDDGNGEVDETGEDIEIHDTIAAFYPEAGLHYWLTHNTRLTVGARYYRNRTRSEERRFNGTTTHTNSPFWAFGVELMILGAPDYVDEPEDPVGPELRQVLMERLDGGDDTNRESAANLPRDVPEEKEINAIFDQILGERQLPIAVDATDGEITD